MSGQSLAVLHQLDIDRSSIMRSAMSDAFDDLAPLMAQLAVSAWPPYYGPPMTWSECCGWGEHAWTCPTSIAALIAEPKRSSRSRSAPLVAYGVAE
jgi:hypothetical protein